MAGYTPLLDTPAAPRKAPLLRVTERVLTAVLFANAALICLCLVLCASADSGSLGSPMGRVTTSRAMPMMARAPRTRVNAAITDANAFKKDIQSRYPDSWNMKADGLYEDLMKQFDEKAKFVASESASMDSKMLSVEELEGQDAGISTGVSGIIATALLVSLPAVTIAGLATGAISTVQPGAM